MLDFFTIMDALKSMKACLNNDFSFFKRYQLPPPRKWSSWTTHRPSFTVPFRTLGFLRKTVTNDDQSTENHALYLFLAHQNSITNNLKTELQQMSG